MKSKWVKLSLLLLAGIALSGYKYFAYAERVEQEKKLSSKLKTAAVIHGNLTLTVAATGKVVSNHDVEIKCKSSGTIVKLPFDVSDGVQQGELLVELDPIDEQRNVDLASVKLKSSEAKLKIALQNMKLSEQRILSDRLRLNASVKSARSALSRLKTKHERLSVALASNAVSKEEVDTVSDQVARAEADLMFTEAQEAELAQSEMSLEIKRQEILLAKATVRADEIELQNALQRKRDTRVLSPITGIVSLRHVQNGQIISSGISNVGGGTTLLTLSDLSRIFTVASVDEADIGMIRVGQDVLVTVDAHPDEKLMGKVVLVATRGVNISNVVTFDVKIEILDEKKHLLKPEMTTNVLVTVKKSTNVAMVPSESLKQVEEGYAVEVLRSDGLIEERKVNVGINDGFFAEVKSGVVKDEKVIMQRSEESSRWKSPEKQKTFPPPPPNI